MDRIPLIVVSLAFTIACSGSSSAPDPAAPSMEGGGDAPVSVADGVAANGCSSDVTARPGTVVTRTGAVSGVLRGGSWSWKGIPYAAPPTGPLRWRAPSPATCWSGEKVTTAFGPQCPQTDADGKVVGAEDCLTLNVWAPEGAANAPVLFFIHGGGNTAGTASDPLYDGSELAVRTGSVVVTVEYRLGALGFLAHGGLDKESSAGVSGNYGILDQIAALTWVKDNIGGFGGAAARVLVFGESAGGQNTLVHLASPLSKGLFAAAAVQSGGVYKTTLAQAQASMLELVDGVGCGAAADVPACMREQPADKLAAFPSAPGPLAKGLQWGPVVDGYVLKGNALEVVARGEHNQVPLIVGTNAHETSRMVPKITTSDEYEAYVRAQYGVAANALLGQYPASAYASPRQALIRLTTDVTWTCPAREFAIAAATHQTQPVYRYYFDWSAPGPAGASVGATHGLELPFVFRTFSALSSGFTPSAKDGVLSDAMQGYWKSLAAAGDPNHTTGIAWPRYDETDPYLVLGTDIAAKTGLAKANCDFLRALAK